MNSTLVALAITIVAPFAPANATTPATATATAAKPRAVVACAQVTDRITRVTLANGRRVFVRDMTVRSPIRGVKWQHLPASNRRVARPRRVDYCRMVPESYGGRTVSLVLNNGAEYHIYRPRLIR